MLGRVHADHTLPLRQQHAPRAIIGAACVRDIDRHALRGGRRRGCMEPVSSPTQHSFRNRPAATPARAPRQSVVPSGGTASHAAARSRPSVPRAAQTAARRVYRASRSRRAALRRRAPAPVALVPREQSCPDHRCRAGACQIGDARRRRAQRRRRRYSTTAARSAGSTTPG